MTFCHGHNSTTSFVSKKKSIRQMPRATVVHCTGVTEPPSHIRLGLKQVCVCVCCQVEFSLSSVKVTSVHCIPTTATRHHGGTPATPAQVSTEIKAVSQTGSRLNFRWFACWCSPAKTPRFTQLGETVCCAAVPNTRTSVLHTSAVSPAALGAAPRLRRFKYWGSSCHEDYTS